ncbi:integrase [Pseudomonas sp. SAS7]
MSALTHLQSPPVSTFVFQPSKGGLWINEPSVTIRHFKSALKALNIRERRQYDTRHTYATMCLMSGMNPAFIANQRGHSVKMLLSTYAKWISSSSDWRELEKLPPRVELAQNWPKIGPNLTRGPKYTSGNPAGQALDFYR